MKIFRLIKVKNTVTSIVVALFVLTSCGTSKVVNTGAVSKYGSFKELIDLHETKDFDFNTLRSRLSVDYSDGKKSFSPNLSLRVEKDKKIWISVKFFGITGAKVFITPDRVSFYEILNKRYYDGDFNALSNFLGTDLDFNKVQNLILGQSILDLKNQKYKMNEVGNTEVQLEPKKQDPLYSILLGLYTNSFKVSSTQVSQSSETVKSIKVMYPTYQKVGTQDFPKQMLLTSQEGNNKKQINVEFKSVDIDTKLSFPYRIPAGYTPFTL